MITSQKIYNIIAAGLLVLCSCKGGGNDPEPAAQRAITFVGDAAPLSRAAGLETQYDNFMVKAVKTMPDASSQLVIPQYKVLHDGSAWYYEGVDGQFLKYWDESADSYRFSAVTPVPNNADDAPIGFKETTVTIGESVVIDNIKGNLSTGDFPNSSYAPDWMVATTVRAQSPLTDTDEIDPSSALHDATSPLSAFTSAVPLRFHPIMARAEFRMWATTALNLNTFKVEVIDDQKIINVGKYSTASGWIEKSVDETLHPLVFGEYTFLDGRIISTKEDNPTVLASHVQIPQTWASPAGRKLRVTVETKTGEVYTGDITLNATTNGGNEWRQGVHYIYVLKIDLDGPSNEVILFDVEMNEWLWLEGSSHENTQTNW